MKLGTSLELFGSCVRFTAAFLFAVMYILGLFVLNVNRTDCTII